jgi:hypothetical protein
VVSMIIATIAASNLPRNMRRELARQICLVANDAADCPPSRALLQRRAEVRERRAARRDRDRDGVPDRLERRYGTNPRSRDSDGDGIGDAAEIRRGTAGPSGRGAPRSSNRSLAFAASNPLRGLRLARSGTLPGRRIDTSDYQRDIYRKYYEGKKPLKYQFKIPDIAGRRGGKLRVGMFISECKPARFGQGDCRGFDSRFHSARTRVTFVFDFESDVLTVLINPSCSREPIRGGCSDPLTPDLGPEDKGTIGGQLGSGQLNVFSGASGTGDRAELGVGYALKNSRFIPKTASPAIDGLITLNSYKDAGGRERIAVNWTNDSYPSLEAYYEPPGRDKTPQTICQSGEESIDDLVGAARTRCVGGF